MKEFAITSVSKDLVGDKVSVRMEVSEKQDIVTRVLDVVYIDLANASRLPEEELLEEAKKAYFDSIGA